MSDEEMDDVADMSVEEEEEDYGFDYSGSEDENMDENDLAVQIENKYYEAKDLLEEDDKKALKLFLEVVKLEEEKGKW